MSDKLTPVLRKRQLLDTALALSELHGYHSVTPEQVADAAKCSRTLIGYHFKTTKKFKDAIMRAAIARGNKIVIMQGIASNNNIINAAILKNANDETTKTINQALTLFKQC